MEEEKDNRSTKVPQFRQDDPHRWFAEFTGYLMRHNMAHLTLTLPKPRSVDTNQDMSAAWEKRNAIAMSYLQEAVNAPHNRSAKAIVFASTNKEKTAKQLCETLIGEFFIKDSRIIHAAQTNFTTLTLLPNEKATSFITRLEEGREQLERHGKTLDEEVDMVGRLIAGIEEDSRYASLASALKLKGKLQWREACRLIQAEELARGPTTHPKSETAKVAVAQGYSATGFDRDTVCQICKKTGHTADRCFHRLKDNNFNKSRNDFNNKQNSGKDITCFYCKKKGHKSFDCRAKKRAEAQKKNNNQMDRNHNHPTGGKKRSSWDDEPGESANMLSRKTQKRNGD